MNNLIQFKEKNYLFLIRGVGAAKNRTDISYIWFGLIIFSFPLWLDKRLRKT